MCIRDSPHWFDGNHVAMGLVQLLLAGIVMVINQKLSLIHISSDLAFMGRFAY